MKELKDLKSDQEHAIRTAEDIMALAEEEDRHLTEKEQKKYEGLLAESDEIEVQIEAHRAHQKQKEEVEARRQAVSTKEARKATGIPANSGPGDEYKKLDMPIRTGANMTCFKGQGGPEEAYKFGAWLGANILGIQFYKTKWREIANNSRALAETVNTTGGALVPIQFADFIINLREEYGVFESEALVWPMTSDVTNVPRINGRMSASFFGEGGTMTTSDLEFGSVNLVAKKSGILTYVSNELQEDSMVEIADLIATEMGHEFAEAVDDAGFNGDAGESYAGILGVANRIEAATGATAYVNATSGTNTFAAIDAEDLANVKAVVSDAAHRRGNAKWYCSRAFFETVFSKLQQAAGGISRSEFAGSTIPSYNGNDVVISQVLETSTGTVNNTAFCLFGDLRQAALLGRRRSIDIAVDGSIRFLTDQTAIRAIQRFDVQTVPEIAASSAVTPMAALIGNT